ncbi:hypothetical protein ABZP36_010006 [Zizania latifolia]
MGKGKVHPSPPLPAAEVAGGETAEAVLMRLLPAAVMAMAEVLGPEGKEVLAYLVLASLRSSSLARWSGEEGNGKGGGSGGGGGASGRAVHPPELGCGCFGCYTAYWSRWDGSPERDREAIHRAIEAFEEHLARKEEGKGGAGAGRRRKKRGKDKPEDKGTAVDAAATAATQPPPPPALPEQEGTSTAATSLPLNAVASCEEAKAADEEDVKATATAAAAAADGDGGVVVEEERRRRGWGAVAGVLNWRGWGLWGSH